MMESNEGFRDHSISSVTSFETGDDIPEKKPTQPIEATKTEVQVRAVNPKTALSTLRFSIILSCLCLGLFMALMDISIISTALYTISVDFHDYRQTIWAALSYTLADISCAVFSTRLSDVFGRKTMILTSFLFFTCFSFAAGFAQTVEQLIIFRTLQGVGGTGLYALTMVICPAISPPKLLPLVVSSMGFTIAVAGVCGPVLGGVITGTTTWRWIFWLNVPIGGLAMVVLFIVWPANMNKSALMDPAKLKQLDYLGAILNAIASICFVFSLHQVGTKEWRWNNPANIGLLTLSGVSTLTFYLWEWYISRGQLATWMLPQLPFRIIKHRPMGIAILTTVLTGFVQFTAVFSIPLRAQIVDLNTPVKSGLRLLPLVAATAIGSLVGGGSSSRGKNITFYIMALSTALMIVGTGLLSSLPSDGAQIKAQYGFEVILGIGFGMTVSTATFLTNLEVELRDHSVAQGTVAQSRILGGSIGIAVSTVVMNKHLQATLQNIVSPAVLQALFISPFTIREYGVSTALAFRTSYIAAFHEDMRISMYVSVAAFMVSLCAWQKNPPTLKERREQLADAIEAYQSGVTPPAILRHGA